MNVPVIGNDNAHKQSEAYHRPQEDVEVDVDGVPSPHLSHDYVPQIHPAFVG